jgi:2'-5' RNA ligase
MRLFVAIPLAPAAREVLGRLLQRFEQRGWPVRWTGADHLHLTIKFLGEVAEEALDGVARALAEAAQGTPPLTLTMGELGAFPSPNRARIIWAGLVAEPALEILADRVERRFQALGFPVEGRPWQPHVTLGRVRNGQWLPPDAVKELGRKLPEASFTATQVVLFESQLGPDGSVHTPRLTVPLGN